MNAVVLEKQNEQCSWVELYVEYKENYKRVKDYRSIVYNSASVSEIEILGSMQSDLQEVLKEIKNRTLYEFGTINNEDIENPMLTERQKKVLELRKRYSSCAKIAEILGLAPGTVFGTYKQAVKKLIKHKSQGKVGVIPGLSPQQEKIYILYKQGKKRKEIAEELNLSINSVKTQLKRIKEKEKRVTKL